jgi:uncharacterized protein
MLHADDSNHEAAKLTWTTFEAERATLVTTNYVVHETVALLQVRLGLRAVRAFRTNILAVVEQQFIDRPLHNAAFDLVLTTNQRKLSLVDATSFLFMRRESLQRAFAFDRNFEAFGFKLA